MIIDFNKTNGGQGSGITVDLQMSDTSTNPVQNKVIKAYVDSHSGGGSGDYVVVSSLDDITSPKYGMKAIVDGTEYVYIQGNPDAGKADRWIPTTIIITNSNGEITDEDKLIFDLVHSKAVCDYKGKDERADAMTPDYLIYGELPFSVKMTYGGNTYFDIVQVHHNFWDNWMQLLYFENGTSYFTRNISKNGDDYSKNDEGHFISNTVTSRGWAGNMPFCLSWNDESGEGAVYLGGQWDNPVFKVDADHPENYQWFGFPDYLINGQIWNGSFGDAAGVFVPYYPVKIRIGDEICTCLNPNVCINEMVGLYEIRYMYVISGFRPVTLICSYDENYNCIDVQVEG